MNHPNGAIAPATTVSLCLTPPALPLEGVAAEIAEVIGRAQTIHLIGSVAQNG